MAQANLLLIEALRETAGRLKNGAYYAWGHHGGCNCGNLLQVVCNVSKEEIVTHAHAMNGEWSEIAMEYCPVSNVPVQLMLKKLEEVGLTPTDIHHIEYLDDRQVLNYLPGGFRWLKRNLKEDVIAYFEAMANMLEDQLLATIVLDKEELFRSIRKTELINA